MMEEMNKWLSAHKKLCVITGIFGLLVSPFLWPIFLAVIIQSLSLVIPVAAGLFFYEKFIMKKDKEERLVLSSSYKNVLENKNYVLTNFYMYISASKNGSQYLDSLGGAAGVSASGSYTCNTFLLEAEERREESL